MVKDRVNVDDSTLDFYKNSMIFADSDNDRKDQYLLAVAIGYSSGLGKKPIEKSHQLVLSKYFNEMDWAILRAIAIADTGNTAVVSDIDAILSISEEYANMGIVRLQSLENENSYDEIMTSFQKLVNNHLVSLNINKDEE